MDFSDIIPKRLVYALPGMEQSHVRPDIVYKSVDGVDLRLDAYNPPNFADGKPFPAVFFIHGDGPKELIKNVKSWGQYISWGQLVAASGLVGITFNHRSSGGRLAGMEAVAADVHDLVAYIRSHADELNIDPDWLCVWACSAGVPYLQEFLAAPPAFVRCLVAYYGMMDFQQFADSIPPEITVEERASTIEHFRKYSLLYHLIDHPTTIPPVFIARAGLDDPQTNQTIDRFYTEASACGLTVELARHPSGHHAFDILDDDDISREIIGHTIRFVQVHLLNSIKNLSRSKERNDG